MNRRVERCAWLVTMLCLAGTSSAQVAPEPAPPPWERDLSAAERRLAEEMFAQAVELHEQLLRDQALTRYEQALSHWENPHIRWNLALLMKDMGRYLRAYEHLERALAWGRAAFDEGDWEQFLAERQMLLQRHLAVVEVLCDQPDAELALDGEYWFRGAGEARQVVLPGAHVITARRPGYFPEVRNIVLPAGTQGVVTVSMSVDGVVQKRRWKPWKPWAVIASGVIVGMVGAGREREASRQLDRARDELDDECGGWWDCDPATPSSYRRALREHRIGTGAMVVGGTVAAAGLILVFLNQPRSYRTKKWDGTFEFVPMASPDMAGVSAVLTF